MQYLRNTEGISLNIYINSGTEYGKMIKWLKFISKRCKVNFTSTSEIVTRYNIWSDTVLVTLILGAHFEAVLTVQIPVLPG